MPSEEKVSTAYLHACEVPTSARSAAASIYIEPDTATINRFNAVNGLDAKQTLYPGHLLVVPSLDGHFEEHLPLSSQIGQQVNFAARHDPEQAQPAIFNNNYHVLNHVSVTPDNLKTMSKVGKAASGFLKYHIAGIEKDLKDLAKVYEGARVSKVNLSSPNFSLMRRPIETALNEKLYGVLRSSILKNPERTSIKDALGISHRSLNKAIRVGNATEVREIQSALSRTSRIAKQAGRVGYVAKALSVGGSAWKTAAAFNTSGATVGFQTMSREAGGIAAGGVGGDLGGTAAAIAAEAALLAFGVGTGGLGFVAIGAATVVGAGVGSYLGSEAGKAGVGYISKKLDAGVSAGVDWFYSTR